jgi:hypothetical protein
MKLFYLVTFVWLFLDTLTINAQSGLVAHWSFDEMTNNIIYDNSSNANHGTNYGASLVPGIVGNALSFDGSNDYVRIPGEGQKPPAVFSTLGKGSISVWFKANKIPTDYGIAPILYYGTEQQCDFFDAANKGLIIELGHSPIYYGSEAIFFTIWKNGCTVPSFCFDSRTAVSSNEWHHYVAVVGENFNTGYLDGVEMTGRRYSFGNASYSQFFEDAIVHEKMWLGKGHWDNTTQFFDGIIDEIMIFDKALTSEEVLDLYGRLSSVNQKNIPRIKILPNPAREILHYDLSEIKEKIQFIRISSTNGEVVIKEKVHSNNKDLYIGKLPEGIYFVDFIGKEKTFHEKVVISNKR